MSRETLEPCLLDMPLLFFFCFTNAFFGFKVFVKSVPGKVECSAESVSELLQERVVQRVCLNCYRSV